MRITSSPTRGTAPPGSCFTEHRRCCSYTDQRGVAQAEGLQARQIQQLKQQPAHPLLADVDPDVLV
jgi:hypothetical protein